ncbi:MAG TPA: imidazole glycerol phosphate synthase subunit HisH [Rhodanobacteraceae bacterium]|nr:imidazole glycerol phosphate synthase subunit HisH [Rhodanobacteraceae bacterium]
MKSDVVLVDAGGSNLGSVRYALERLGVDAAVSADAARIRRASHVILPGVGTAGEGMRWLAALKLIEVLRELTQPVLGVCLGMQLLFEHSDEDDVACLGLIPGRVQRIADAPGRRVPHMGWNRLHKQRDDPLWRGIDEGAWAYFVHSYAVATNASAVASTSHVGAWAAMVRQRNFCGMQFHPERSSAVGARLLRNFLDS